MGNILRQTATGRRATMRLLLHLAAAILLLSASAAGAADYPSEEPRLALVIGNGAYPVDPLKNAVQDAQALAATLTALGFSVTQLQNAGYREMLDALRNFGQNMQRQRGTALFYFSGHGLQLEGENYLLPIDSDIRRAHEIKYSALHVAQVLDEMEYANNRVNIVVLDASRNSSFAGEYRSVSRGLAQVDAPGGTLIALSTAPGNVSDDSEEHSGLYTKQLIANLSTPGLPVEQIFKRVRVDVMRASGGAQVPWENSSLVGDFYFSPPRDGLSATTAPSGDAGAISSATTSQQLKSGGIGGLEQHQAQRESGRLRSLFGTLSARAIPSSGQLPATQIPPPKQSASLCRAIASDSPTTASSRGNRTASRAKLHGGLGRTRLYAATASRHECAATDF